MKKRILCLMLGVCFLFVFTSCSIVRSVDYVYSDATVVSYENTATKVYEDVSDACVGIYTKLANNEAYSGSGVIYKKENGYFYCITNEHVVSNGISFQVYDGVSKYYQATLVGSDSTNDIAVLKFSDDIVGSNLKAIDIDSYEDALKPGEYVMAIGCPLGLEYANTATLGIVSKLFTNRIQHDAAINPGNSGGGLFNMLGHLVGINVSKQDYVNTGSETIPVEGMGYAISMQIVKICVNDIETKETTISRPTLGVTVKTINKYTSDSKYVECLPSTVEQAVLVTNVEYGSAAKTYGIKANDVIKSVNSIEITQDDELGTIIKTSLSGDSLEIALYRYEAGAFKIVTITVVL